MKAGEALVLMVWIAACVVATPVAHHMGVTHGPVGVAVVVTVTLIGLVAVALITGRLQARTKAKERE